MGEWRCSSTILDFGIRRRWVVSFTPLPLYSRGYSPWYSLGGPQRRSQCYGEEKILFLPGIEQRLSSPQPIASRCQGTAGEDIASCKRLSGCCGDVWIVEISSVITSITTSGKLLLCSSAMTEDNKSFQTPESYSTTTTLTYREDFISSRELLGLMKLHIVFYCRSYSPVTTNRGVVVTALTVTSEK
jgi:hypothetical protein